jgi:hypothetical protein
MNDAILGIVSESSLCGMMTISVGHSEPEHVQYPKFLSPGCLLKLVYLQSHPSRTSPNHSWTYEFRL